jgi:lysophospholipase L1-like esterase
MGVETMLPPETAFLVDFNVPQVPAALGLEVPSAAAAAMLGIPEAQFSGYTSAVQVEVAGQARQLLAEPAVADAVARMPIPEGSLALAVGDSITTYRRSYARLLAEMLAQGRPASGIRFLNGGQSGYTSTLALEVTYTQFLAQQPNLVLIMIGVNDCKIFGCVRDALAGSDAGHTLVPLEAYRANLQAIVEAFQAHTRARLVLLSPTPVIEAITSANPDFAAMRLRWDNGIIAAYAAAVEALAAEHCVPFVDLVGLFGDRPDPALYLPDGVHPGPAGHLLIVREVLRAFAP